MNTTPLTFIPRRTPRHRRRPGAASAAALTLVSAEVLTDGGEGTLRLTFDRAIDVSALDPSAVTVQDNTPGAETAYAGVGVDDFPDPASVTLVIESTGPSAPGPTRMTATAATGIVASDDGAAWAGVTDLALPFP